MAFYDLFLALGTIGSAVFGWFGSREALSAIAESRNRKALKEASTGMIGSSVSMQSHGFSRWILYFCIVQSYELKAQQPKRDHSMLYLAGTKSFEKRIRLAGLSSVCSLEGLYRARIFVCLGFALGGSAFGLFLSLQMLFVGLMVGAIVGWFCIPWALNQETLARKQSLERHLSEAIEVICLGLRSGLSFDFAFQMYCECFGTALSNELFLASREWQAGLSTREQSLRNVASTYESIIFSRIVENIVRSTRFGSPLAEGLEVLAIESRQCHKAFVEEKVMKAPIKMMLPVGTLILPSMLILVLGPVVLDLAQGF